MSNPREAKPNETSKPETDRPAAGPHADSKLTNKDATPGTGSLPDDTSDNEADVGSD